MKFPLWIFCILIENFCGNCFSIFFWRFLWPFLLIHIEIFFLNVIQKLLFGNFSGISLATSITVLVTCFSAFFAKSFGFLWKFMNAPSELQWKFYNLVFLNVLLYFFIIETFFNNELPKELPKKNPKQYPWNEIA